MVKEEWDQYLLQIDEFMNEKTSWEERNQFVTGVNVGTSPSLALSNINDDSIFSIESVINNQSSLFVLLRHFA